MDGIETALSEFKDKILNATGRVASAREVDAFHRQVQTAEAHRDGRVVQLGLCDFQTLDGRATTIEVSY